MGVPTDSHGNTGLGKVSLGLSWTFASIAILAVAGRFVVRSRTLKKFAFEDWLMLLALVIQIIFQAMFTVMIGWGEGLAFDLVTAEQKLQISRWGWISAIPSILTSMTARISIAILLVHLFGIRRWLKWYFIIFTGLLSVMSVLSIIFLTAQCTPWEGVWNKAIGPRCWNPYIYAYTALATQFLYAISDFTYVLFPVCIIFSLDLPLGRKIAIAALMGVSIFTMGIVVTKIVVVLLRLTNPLAATGTLARYYQSLTNLVASLEQSLVITLGCIPTLRPTRLKLPSLRDMGSWVNSLVSTIRSSRSRRGSSSRSSHSVKDSSYQDLELEPRQRAQHDSASVLYVVTLNNERNYGQGLPKKSKDMPVTRDTITDIEYS